MYGKVVCFNPKNIKKFFITHICVIACTWCWYVGHAFIKYKYAMKFLTFSFKTFKYSLPAFQPYVKKYGHPFPSIYLISSNKLKNNVFFTNRTLSQQDWFFSKWQHLARIKIYWKHINTSISYLKTAKFNSLFFTNPMLRLHKLCK